MAVWLAVLGLAYLVASHFLQPKPVVITANGDLVIPKSRNGHFYAMGTVNGKPARFLVDTGATLVVVSREFAAEAKLTGGVPTSFTTANGKIEGRIVHGVPVSVGPVSVSGVTVGWGMVGNDANDALLGQSFLQKFDVLLSKDQMVLRQR